MRCRLTELKLTFYCDRSGIFIGGCSPDARKGKQVDVLMSDAWVIVIKYSLATGLDLYGSGNISMNAGNDRF